MAPAVKAGPLWTFDVAQPMIANLQESAKRVGFHIALGGGVLNNLKSNKDLDLYFLPMRNGESSNADELLAALESVWGKLQPFSEYGEDDDDGIWTFKGKLDGPGGKRVDIWIM